MERVVIGQIVASHGIRGQVRVFPLTDKPDRFKDLDEVYLDQATEPVGLESASLHKNMVLVKLEGVGTRDQADALRGTYIEIPLADRLPLEKDHYYISDLEGLEVLTDQGQALGRLSRVLTGHANPVLEITSDGGEVLVPMVKEFVKEIDLEAGRIIISPIEGMIG